MIPVLGFFNKTEWRLFPEYSLEISNDKKNITLSIEVEGTQQKLTIENENLAKTCDAIIDDAIKNNFAITKTSLTGDPIFQKLKETYNDKEWIPTILMIDTINAKNEIKFDKTPMSTPDLNPASNSALPASNSSTLPASNSDDLKTNVKNKIDESLTPNSSNLPASNSDDLKTKINGALASSTSSTSSTISTVTNSSVIAAVSSSNANDMINSVFVKLNEKDDIGNTTSTSSDNLPDNMKDKLNSALSNNSAIVTNAADANLLVNAALLILNSNNSITTSVVVNLPENVADKLNEVLAILPVADPLLGNVMGKINDQLNSSKSVTSLPNENDASGLINSAFASLNNMGHDPLAAVKDDLPVNVMNQINYQLNSSNPVLATLNENDASGLINSAFASLNNMGHAPIAAVKDDLPGNVMNQINKVIEMKEPEDPLLENVMNQINYQLNSSNPVLATLNEANESNANGLINSAFASLNNTVHLAPTVSPTVAPAVAPAIASVVVPITDNLPGNVMKQINKVLEMKEPEDPLLENVMEKINKVLKTEDMDDIIIEMDSLPENVEKSINDALNSAVSGGKRNPDRERVYKLPIQKRRTDNYYNYE